MRLKFSYVHAHNDIKFEEDAWQQFYFNGGPIALYPHKIEDIVIVVPNRHIIKFKLFESIFDSPILQIWIPFSIACTIIRQLIQYITGNNWCTRSLSITFFNTFSLAIGTININLRKSKKMNQYENLITIYISFFGVLSGILFTGALFQKFTINVALPNIDSIVDLEKSGLNLFMSFSDNGHIDFGKFVPIIYNY